MRFAGACFIIIVLLCLLQISLINEYIKSAEESIRSFDKPKDLTDLVSGIRNIGLAQLAFLFAAGIGLLNHTGMSENDTKNLFSEIDKRVKYIEKINNISNENISQNTSDTKSEINQILGI